MIDPEKQTVDVYRVDFHEQLENPAFLAATGPLKGFVLDLNKIWRGLE